MRLLPRHHEDHDHPELRTLRVTVTAQVDLEPERELVREVEIPPGYDAADVHALTARFIEDTAFALNRREFGRRPTLQALLAAVARLRAIEWLLDNREVEDDTAAYIRGVLERSNDDITEEWGESPDDHA